MQCRPLCVVRRGRAERSETGPPFLSLRLTKCGRKLLRNVRPYSKRRAASLRDVPLREDLTSQPKFASDLPLLPCFVNNRGYGSATT